MLFQETRQERMGLNLEENILIVHEEEFAFFSRGTEEGRCSFTDFKQRMAICQDSCNTEILLWEEVELYDLQNTFQVFNFCNTMCLQILFKIRVLKYQLYKVLCPNEE